MPPTIRLADESDAEAFLAIYSPFCTHTAVSFEEEPPGVEEMRRRIRTALAEYPWLVCADGECVLGYAYAGRHRERASYRWSADVTVYVAPERHRRGVGRALYASLLGLLALQGYYNAYAGITLPNPASVGLHEAMGFRPVGVYSHVGYKLGAWRDVGWWQLALRAHDPDPAPPAPLPLAVALTGWPEALSAGEAFLNSGPS